MKDIIDKIGAAIAILFVPTCIILCCGGIFYSVEVGAKRQKEELELKILSFCDGQPVEVTNTYLVREGSKPANYCYPAYAVVKHDGQTMTVKFNHDKGVTIGESWYLTVVREGDNCHITLDKRFVGNKR